MVNRKEGENCSKLVLEALTATMTKMMDERFEVYQKMKEQELKPKPPDNTMRSIRSSPQKIPHTPKSKHVLYHDYQPTNELYKFSGKIDYLKWEKNMDEWFYYHNFLSEKRLGCAISQLTGDAYKYGNAFELFRSKTEQKITGVMVKHTYLGEVTTSKSTFNVLHHDLRRAEGALNPLTIKEKPPDWHQPPYIRKESKDRSMSETRDFIKGKTDLRSNPFQLGEDDMIMGSLGHGTNGQLEDMLDHQLEDMLDPHGEVLLHHIEPKEHSIEYEAKEREDEELGAKEDMALHVATGQ
ncbi:hypothetical protein ISN45_Aa01g029820 [Arabidopsis thaliana x Arabidopsis arenosa]|uniref:Uncharacterized protein n=1 Tax=Arabidopsis thaliana x Arabidopsis arenosa TaxID=1240361 RepID=A0A8T2CB47_9BRAS|nr:hypothetical protein ISN45_Aa01g029820 [Arabidopsis thaliana x Arabidopsis arenosa]